MKKIVLLVIIGLTLSSMAFGQEVYKWVDEKGTAHFTDNLGLVPEKYRDQILTEKRPKEPTPSPSPSLSPPPFEPPKSTEAGKEAGPTPVQKDILGRGEEWWRTKAIEWNEKFKTARRNYEMAYSEWKAKENELEASKFKPDSVKRKLKVEIKVLEEKTKDWEKQMEEANNMLENVLPKQARDYQADPRWLKIEDK
jgi:hypothetical protein